MDFLADTDPAPDEVQDVEDAKRRFAAQQQAIRQLAQHLGARLEVETHGTTAVASSDPKR